MADLRERLEDSEDLVSALKEDEEDPGRLCLPRDVWAPFEGGAGSPGRGGQGSGGGAEDPFSGEFAAELWGAADLRELGLRGGGATFARIESLIR